MSAGPTLAAVPSAGTLASKRRVSTRVPPALDSAQWAAQFNEVKSLGRATGSTRTDEQTYIARWWQSAPGLSWNEVARQLITRNHLNAADAAERAHRVVA